jgi:hypothetical protein
MLSGTTLSLGHFSPAMLRSLPVRISTILAIAALTFGTANVALAQGSTADTSRAINGPANSDTANHDAHKTIHGHMKHRHTRAPHY